MIIVGIMPTLGINIMWEGLVDYGRLEWQQIIDYNKQPNPLRKRIGSLNFFDRVSVSSSSCNLLAGNLR
jgi:hypothetical protein